MSTEKIIETHQLTVTFDQFEDGCVNWTVDANEEVKSLIRSNLHLQDLAAADCSLAAIGIQALWEQCDETFIQSALERAALAQWQVVGGRELAFQQQGAPMEHADAVTLN